MISFVQRFIDLALRISNKLLFIFTFIFIIVSSHIAYYLEPDTFETKFNALWWVMTTVTTVGYGDVSPVTEIGKSFAMFLFLYGIGLIGVVIAKITDGFMIFKVKREKGDIVCKESNHVIIIGWSRKAQLAIDETLEISKDCKVLLIDTLEKAPVLSDRVLYLNGDPTEEETYEKANLKEASSVLIFADDNIVDIKLTDGQTFLTAAMVRDYCEKVHITAEVKNKKHLKMFTNKNVRGILSNELISHISVQSAFYNGVSEVYSQLMSHKKGQDLFNIEKQNHWITYQDAFTDLLKQGATLISDGDKLDINEKLEEKIPENASLYIIASKDSYKKIIAKK